MKKNKKLLIITIISVIMILIFNFYKVYSIQKQPPSDTWSKELVLGQGTANDPPTLIKDKDKVLVAYEGQNKVTIAELSLDGKTLNNKEYSIDYDFIKNMMFVKGNDGYYILYNYESMSKGKFEVIHLNNELQEVKREQYEGIKSSYQIDSNNIFIGSDSEGVIVDTLSKKQISLPIELINSVAITKNSTYMVFATIDKQCKITIGKVDGNGEITYADKIGLLLSDKIDYKNFTVSSDNSYAYFVYEEYIKGEYSGTKCIQLDLNTNELLQSNLDINGNKELSNIKGIKGDDKSKFYAAINRNLGSNKIQQNIVSFSVDNGQTINSEMVSRVRQASMYPYGEEDYVVYLSYNGSDGNYNVNLSSTNNEFKNANNGNKSNEVKNAFLIVLENLLMSVAYMFIIGIQWMLPSFVIGGIASFFEYKLNNKNKKVLYIVLSIITVLIQLIAIRNSIYSANIVMQTLLSSSVVGSIACIIIGIIIFGGGYLQYADNLDEMFIAKYSLVTIINSLAVCILLIPLIL